MKGKFRNTLVKGLCLALFALPFAAQISKAATITANLSDVTNQNTQNYPTVKVTFSDVGVPAGTVKVKVEVVPGATGGTADLRGFFFSLPNIRLTGATITPTGGGPITAVSGVTNSFGSIGNSANLQGSGATFGVGVEVGRQGIGGTPPDDFQSTEFTISGTGLTLAGFSQAQFGARMMSVSTSAGGARDLSSKTLGNGGTVVTPSPSTSPTGGGGGGSPSPSPSTSSGGGGGGSTPVDVPEPIALVALGVGLGGILLSRRNRSKK